MCGIPFLVVHGEADPLVTPSGGAGDRGSGTRVRSCLPSRAWGTTCPSRSGTPSPTPSWPTRSWPPSERPSRLSRSTPRASQAALGFGRPGERRAIDADDPELRPVAQRPLEVVEQRPVGVAPHVDPVGEGLQHARQRLADVVDALLVVGGADAVLGDQQGNRTAGVVPGPSQTVAERRRVELVCPCRGWARRPRSRPIRRGRSACGCTPARRGSRPPGGIEEHVLGVVPDALELLFAARRELVVGHGRVRPTGTPGAPARMVSTATRCAAARAGAATQAARRRSCPGEHPACQPMVATMFGSLRCRPAP